MPESHVEFARLKEPDAQDIPEITEWTLEKAKRFKVDLTELAGVPIAKDPGKFYCGLRACMLVGPLIPNPNLSGAMLGLALVRMIKDIRKNFEGDIIFITRGMPDGIDALAKEVGFELDGSLMRLRGTYGL